MGECTERKIQHDTAMVDKFLELSGCSGAVMCQQVGLTTQVSGEESSQLRRWWLAQFIGSSRFQQLQYLGCIATIGFNSCLDSRQPIKLEHRIRWIALL